MKVISIDGKKVYDDVKDKIDIKYLTEKIEEGLIKNAFQNKSIEAKNDVVRPLVLVALTEDLYDKYGEKSFKQRLRANPYLLIKEAVDYIKKHNLKEISSTMKVDYVDPTTHKRVKNADGTYKKVLPSKEYIDNRAWYENKAKAKIESKFKYLAGIGRGKSSIHYESFKQNIGAVEKPLGGGKYRQGFVSTYTTKDKNAVTSIVYIIEWESGEGFEVLTKNEFFQKFPNFQAGKIEYHYNFDNGKVIREYNKEEYAKAKKEHEEEIKRRKTERRKN